MEETNLGLSNVFEKCTKSFKEDFTNMLKHALAMSLHPTRLDALSELSRSELICLMTITSLGMLNVTMSKSLLRAVDSWNLLPRITSYFGRKMKEEYYIPKSFLLRALRFAEYTNKLGFLQVPATLVTFIKLLIQEAGKEDVLRSSCDDVRVEDRSRRTANLSLPLDGAVYGLLVPDSPSHPQGPDSPSHPQGPDSPSHPQGPDSSSHPQGPDQVLSLSCPSVPQDHFDKPQEHQVDQIDSGASSAVASRSSQLPESRSSSPVSEKPSPIPPTVPSPSPSVRPSQNNGPALQVADNRVGATEKLWDAVWRGDGRAVEEALNAGADPRARDEVKDTPLHVAASKGCEDGIRFLLASGAEVETKGCSGHTPLHCAVRSGSTDCMLVLLDTGAGANPTTDIALQTPLHWAAECGHLPCVKLLVERGADVNAKDRNGRTPLALSWEHRSTLQYLRNVSTKR